MVQPQTVAHLSTNQGNFADANNDFTNCHRYVHQMTQQDILVTPARTAAEVDTVAAAAAVC